MYIYPLECNYTPQTGRLVRECSKPYFERSFRIEIALLDFSGYFIIWESNECLFIGSKAEEENYFGSSASFKKNTQETAHSYMSFRTDIFRYI